jgi:hydroxymethylglutaryl-CoA reductase (NADPH)
MAKFTNDKDRRQFLENTLKIKLTTVGQNQLDENLIANRNCENVIGGIQVPLGIAGPLVVLNNQTKTQYYLPLATTEGALVASVNRGCKATRLSGGIITLAENIGVTRGPVFRTQSIVESWRLTEWLQKNLASLQTLASTTSSHLQLLKLETAYCGKDVFVRFYFDTAEAMGMNMVTKATQALANYIEGQTSSVCLSLSGNYCVDKKPSWLNFIKGRGKRVWAETTLKRAVVNQVLKTQPEKIVEVVNKKCHLGSIMSGSTGFNSHFANIVAALFLATGQDIAHVSEASTGVTIAELTGDNDLYFSVYIPDLMLGTIGGGTQLSSQKEALSILGLDKGSTGDSEKLARITGAAVLAGELSLVAALSAGHLVAAHEKLGRNKP